MDRSADTPRSHAAAVPQQNCACVEIGLDKLSTNELLRRHGLPGPWTRIVGDAPPDSLPCILKRRRGRGSKGLVIVRTDEEVRKLAPVRAGDLWQELLLPADEEYTCGVYGESSGAVRTIVFRRTLENGITKTGEIAESAEIDRVLVRIAKALELKGSINVQLRVTKDGPRVFEINPRFSSTVEFRNILGFRDFIWSIAEMNGQKLPPYRPPAKCTRVNRIEGAIVMK